MSDLRTRIAAALAKADQDWCSDNPLYEDMADAVIRELGLTREQLGQLTCQSQPVHRYVTTWNADA